MSKNRVKKKTAAKNIAAETAETVEVPVEKEVEVKTTESVEAAEKEEVKYAFPSKSRCPRCGVLDTVAYTTRGPIQYRQCQRAVCRRKYSVTGTPV